MHVCGNIRVVADDDQHRRPAVLAGGRVPHLLELLLPFAGQCEERVLDLSVESFRLRSPAGEPLAGAQAARDVTPEPEVLRIGTAGVVDRRQTGDLRDAALDGVDQAEIGDDPREGRPLGIAAALDVERRGREIHAQLDAAGSVDRIEPVDPDGRLLAVCLCVGRDLNSLLNRRRPVGVMSLVVQNHERLVVPQVAESIARERLGRLAAQAAHCYLPDAHFFLLGAEPVPVGHHYLPLGKLGTKRGRHEVERLVVVVRVARVQYAEAFPNRQVGADHQHAVWIAGVARLRAAVTERPRDEHCHDDRLPAACRHLARIARNRLPAVPDRDVGQLRRLRHLRYPGLRPRVDAAA